MFGKYVSLLVLVAFAAGCGVEARTYVMRKDRVGLEQTGNGGCISGKCPQTVPSKTTRKIYVLELTKPVPESEVRKIEQAAANAIVSTTQSTPSSDTAAPADAPAATVDNQSAPTPSSPVIPVITDQSVANTPDAQADTSAAVKTYTVQKDDTLQKISKKVFGTYSKWYKLYVANKAKIKNPNFLKPGTVLDIPNLK